MSNVGTQFKPGNNANPNGAPKKAWTMSSILRESLEEEDENGTPHKVLINRKLRDLARKGDLVAIKEINNRIDGQARQDITSNGEKITGPTVFIPQEKDE